MELDRIVRFTTYHICKIISYISFHIVTRIYENRFIRCNTVDIMKTSRVMNNGLFHDRNIFNIFGLALRSYECFIYMRFAVFVYFWVELSLSTKYTEPGGCVLSTDRS